MTAPIKLLLIVSIVCILPGCASIVSKTSWPIMIHSDPSGASVIINNKKGREVFRGRTPTAARLKSGAGFFKKESYTVTLVMNGYAEKVINVDCKLNAWYFGNILFGGVLGLLIIDPATGAMYKLKNDGIFEALDKSVSSSTLRIMHKSDIPADWDHRLVKIN